MPIYAYRCEACGHAKDVLQKMSDPVLTTCPACGVEAFKKQVTAAGFQLKGSGWYVTDFRGGGTSGAQAEKSVEGDAKATAPAVENKTPDTPSAAAAAAPAAAPAAASSATSATPSASPPSSPKAS